MDITSSISDEYFNYIINPTKIAGNYSLEKISYYIMDFSDRLQKIKASRSQYLTQELLNKINRLEVVLASLNLAYIIRESDIAFIPPPSGMSWLLNCNLNP
jgi:hypothetical protein